jgi:Muramidase (flagellum-specific)
MSSIRKIVLVLILLVFSTHLFLYGQRAAREAYVEKYKDLAIRQMNSHGIPASIIMAQACLESGDGKSYLAVKGNNHFGIKCHNWTGERIYHDDDRRGECFRKYPSVEQSYTDHSDFLRYSQRYASLFDLKPNDYKGWARGLKAAGYATNPRYAEMLIDIIEEYSLYKLDNIDYVSIPPSPSAIIKEGVAVIDTGSTLYRLSIHRQIYSRNGIKYIIASSYDTYASIAKEFNLFTNELLRFNDLSKRDPIESGTVLYIEKKRKEGDRYMSKHVVESGETMHTISQKYGIKLANLYKLNGMKRGDEPAVDDIINLR